MSLWSTVWVSTSCKWSLFRGRLSLNLTVEKRWLSFCVQRNIINSEERRVTMTVVLYRFTKVNIWTSNHFLGEELNERRGGAICKVDKLKIFLRYVVDPGFQSGVGEDLGVHQSSVSKVVTQTMDKIIEKTICCIKFIQSAGDIHMAKEMWQIRYNFPCAVGVIDCPIFLETNTKIEKGILALMYKPHAIHMNWLQA